MVSKVCQNKPNCQMCVTKLPLSYLVGPSFLEPQFVRCEKQKAWNQWLGLIKSMSVSLLVQKTLKKHQVQILFQIKNSSLDLRDI